MGVHKEERKRIKVLGHLTSADIQNLEPGNIEFFILGMYFEKQKYVLDYIILLAKNNLPFVNKWDKMRIVLYCYIYRHNVRIHGNSSGQGGNEQKK